MGVNVTSVTMNKDYVTGERFIELHRRIYAPGDVCDKLTHLMKERKWDRVAEILIEYAADNAKSTISAMLEEASLIDSGENNRTMWEDNAPPPPPPPPNQ